MMQSEREKQMSSRFPVSPETERMLELGHPWVIADRHTRAWPKGRCGEVIPLSGKDGRTVATALYEPGARVVARVLAAGEVRIDRGWLLARLRMAADVRRWLELDETDVYRLVNGEGDGLPGLTIDRYGDYRVIQLYTEAWRPHLEMISDALQEFDRPRGIYVKGRPQQTRELEARHASKNYAQLLAGERCMGKLVVRENGLSFLVDLEEGLNTGLFLDMRAHRRRLMRKITGRSLLNLFCYTGAFSVAAACAGASQVTSVDVSPGYLDWARENFSANGLDPQDYEFIVGDCLEALRRMAEQGRTFGLVLMDPPSFSTTRKSRFSTRGGTSELITAALKVLEPGGLLMCASNHQKVDVADYLKELRRGALAAERELRVIHLGSQGGDFPYPVTFPEGRYLKFVTAVCP